MIVAEQGSGQTEKLAEDEGNATSCDIPLSIVNQIFGTFSNVLAQMPGMDEVATDLRKALIEDGARSEAAIRKVLFGGWEA